MHPVAGSYGNQCEGIGSSAFSEGREDSRLKFDGGEGACFHDIHFLTVRNAACFLEQSGTVHPLDVGYRVVN